MKRVMIPQNLLVWAVVDTDTGEVTDLWASDIEDNYWDDAHVEHGVLYHLDDWEDENVSDPVEEDLARKSVKQLQDARLPKLRIEESSR